MVSDCFSLQTISLAKKRHNVVLDGHPASQPGAFAQVRPRTASNARLPQSQRAEVTEHFPPVFETVNAPKIIWFV